MQREAPNDYARANLAYPCDAYPACSPCRVSRLADHVIAVLVECNVGDTLSDVCLEGSSHTTAFVLTVHAHAYAQAS